MEFWADTMGSFRVDGAWHRIRKGQGSIVYCYHIHSTLLHSWYGLDAGIIEGDTRRQNTVRKLLYVNLDMVPRRQAPEHLQLVHMERTAMI